MRKMGFLKKSAMILTVAMLMSGTAMAQEAGWQWIDKNGDGISECYYYFADGDMAVNETTPDGCWVNEAGAWVVDGTVQTRASNADYISVADTGSYDPQYPLAGMPDQLGLNFGKDQLGNDRLYWSQTNLNWAVGYDAAPVMKWQKANETNDLSYYYTIENADDMLAIAKLAGLSINLPYADEAKAEAIANNVREFLQTFSDWRTASDYDKVCHVVRWITQAEYDEQKFNQQYRPEEYKPEEVGENIYTSYGCLIDKQCVCAGYTEAAMLLSAVVGLECIYYVPYLPHVRPVFKVNGVWLECEPTGGKDTASLQIFDVYYHKPNSVDPWRTREEDVKNDYPGNRAKFFYDRGYVVPTNLDGKFDPSVIGSMGNYRDHLDFGLYEVSGETTSEDTLRIIDPCGHFQDYWYKLWTKIGW